MQVRWVCDGDRKVLQQWFEDQWQDVPEIMRNASLSFPGGEDAYTPGRHSLKDDCGFNVGDWVISKRGRFHITELGASSTPTGSGTGPIMYKLEPLYKTGSVLFLTCSELKRDFEKYQVKKFNLREELGIEKQENVSDGKQKYIEYKSPSKGCSFEYKMDWMKNMLEVIYQIDLEEPKRLWVRNLELRVMYKHDRFIGDRVLHEDKAYDIIELYFKPSDLSETVDWYGLQATDNSYKISMTAEEVMTLEVVVKSELRNYIKVLI